MAGDLVYFVIPVPDGERGRKFYGELLGWQFDPGNIPGGYQISNATPPGGLFGGGPGNRPRVYFEVDDIEAGVEKVRELGGEAGEPEQIESGFMADCKDDQGTEFSLWAARKPAGA